MISPSPTPLQGVTDALSALLKWRQATRLLTLTTPLGADALLVERVTGQEGMSQGFTFEIMALSTNAHLEVKVLTGQPVLLELLTAIPAGSALLAGALPLMGALGGSSASLRPPYLGILPGAGQGERRRTGRAAPRPRPHHAGRGGGRQRRRGGWICLIPAFIPRAP